MNIRVLLLRLIISWWFIPCVYVILLPVIYLICGDFKGTLEYCNEMAHSFWDGEI